MADLPLSRSGRRAGEVAAQALREAGEIVVGSFSGEKGVRLKSRKSLVTETDLRSERVILGRLQDEFPNYQFLSEESEAIPSSSVYTWVVDPLDGTNNFSFGIPLFSLVVALLEGEEVVLGLTYDPCRNELFRAEKGKGAFLNEHPIQVSTRCELEKALVVCDLGYDVERGGQMLEVASRLWPQLLSLRVLGSGALSLAYVAAGRIDLYLHRSLYPWDVLAGKLLAEEAGGKVSDWEGRPLNSKAREVVAGNPELHMRFMRWLQGH